MKLNTESNVYTIIYASVMVVIVAILLAFVSQSLQEKQEYNKRLDVQKQILTALNVEYTSSNAGELYSQLVKEHSYQSLPYYTAELDGETKYVLRLRGQGLWGAIWGYIALNSDKNTVYGINFGNESETPGLGGEIVTVRFREQFKGKHIMDAAGVLRSIAVLKAGKIADGQEQVDALSGATITCTGVNEMLATSLNEYNEFLTTVDEKTYEEASVLKTIDKENNE